MTSYRISQVAERCGLPATTLRFYEDQGLLAPRRTPSGYRLYGDETVERLKFIKAAKRVGLSLDDIREILPVWDHGGCPEVRDVLRPLIEARLADTDEHVGELRAFAAHLTRARQKLDAIAPGAGPCSSSCEFVDSEEPQLLQITDAPVGRPGPVEGGVRVACSLDGDGQAGRVEEWRRLLSETIDHVRLANGVRVSLPMHTAGRVAELAAAELQCCPFFEFSLQLGGERLHLEVRGPAEAAGLIEEYFVSP
ncbi:heavy metal-responsive transcriptional regulator [Streptomyces vastus]|uniref:MerR family transcriptional regulator n=1 Tax=Streptomyces vastus TaxID=285451 RepID=A0ABN3QC21_9ACTN